MYTEGSKTRTFAIVLAVLLAGLGAGVWLDQQPVQSKKTAAKLATKQLYGALRQFYTEYGRWPPVSENGLILNAEQNAALIRALRGQDAAANPRGISFIEIRSAERRALRRVNGVDPKTGAFLDPRGNPYQIAFDADFDELIPSPYPSDERALHIPVVVWSLGKDGKLGAEGNAGSYIGSDDVTSWRD